MPNKSSIQDPAWAKFKNPKKPDPSLTLGYIINLFVYALFNLTIIAQSQNNAMWHYYLTFMHCL